jgi:hypothetical protein
MDRTIKLIWDFYGDDAQFFAEHHQKHLNEFAHKENLALKNTSTEKIGDHHFIACLLAKESQVFMIRDAVKPKRAELIEE